MNRSATGRNALQTLARQVVAETIDVWENHVREGRGAIVQSHRKSFSVLARAEVPVEDGSVTDYLTGLLREENEMVRLAAAEGLNEIGNRASTTAEALVELLSDENEYIRRRAIEAAGIIAPPPQPGSKRSSP